MKFIDLRSDTVTHPTPAMRTHMAEAEVGDDVYGDDPTVNRLEALAAEMLGKQAGLFVPSGTMGNLASILAHCGRGDEAIMGTQGHTFLFEAGGISALGGVFAHTIPNQPDGTLLLDDIRRAIRPTDDPHQPISRLVILENTQNRCGGVPLTVGYTREVADLAHGRGLLLHLDGARLFNAAAALGVSARELAGPADSVTICLSKGLCAPVGSVICGTKDFIDRAHRIRKQLGGGMRQAGILAAAGIVALEQMVARLSEDHARARRLAEGLAQLDGLSLTYGLPASNMVFISIDPRLPLTGGDVARFFEARGVLVSGGAGKSMRLVLHYWIDDAAVDNVLGGFQQLLAEVAARRSPAN